MEITRQKSGDLLVLRLTGRLDANWCGHVQDSLSAAVRDGEHRIHLEMAGVSYVSSAGLRVLLSFYKQLRAIGGSFGVARPSDAVRSVLELAGLEMLVAAAEAGPVAAETGRPHASPRARYELFPIAGGTGGFRVRGTGGYGALNGTDDGRALKAVSFAADAVALGAGALGGSDAGCADRCGELLATAGTAAFQPSDGSSRPDFMLSQGALVPEGRLLVGIFGVGTFGTLARFEAEGDPRTVGLAELAETALGLAGSRACVFSAVAETSGLVGAALRRSPAQADGDRSRFGFPQIRDWLSFTGERAFRDSTSLIVGIAARPGSDLDPLMRPLGRTDSGILGHVHAAVFPYRPLRKGRIELASSVAELFEGPSLQAVLHLLSDSREFNGAGESEFYRGAIWIAPVLEP